MRETGLFPPLVERLRIRSILNLLYFLSFALLVTLFIREGIYCLGMVPG